LWTAQQGRTEAQSSDAHRGAEGVKLDKVWEEVSNRAWVEGVSPAANAFFDTVSHQTRGFAVSEYY